MIARKLMDFIKLFFGQMPDCQAAKLPPDFSHGQDAISRQPLLSRRIYFFSAVATVLVGKLEMIIFEEAVHEDDELAHAGGHGHKGFLSGGAQPQVKFLEDAVVAHGRQRSHVKRVPCCAPSALDSSVSLLSATVTVVRSDSRQRGSGSTGESSQFGHFGQHGGSHDRADARNGFESAGLVSELGVLCNEQSDGFIALGDLLFQDFAEPPGLAETEGVGVMLGVVTFIGKQLDELASALGEISQLLLLR